MKDKLILNGEEIELSKETIANFKKQLGIKDKPKTIWDLKWGDKYYYIGIVSIGNMGISTWCNTSTDNYRRNTGLIALTKEGCEEIIKRKKKIAEMQQWKHENDPDGYELDWGSKNQSKYEIYLNHDACKFSISAYYYYQTSPKEWYFSTEAKARKFIDKFGDDYKKYVLGVK